MTGGHTTMPMQSYRSKERACIGGYVDGTCESSANMKPSSGRL